MRPLVLIGIIVAIVGGILLYNGGNFTTRKSLVEIGDVKITAPDEHAIPKWAAGIAILAGVGLVVVGSQRRGST
jgi:membrane protein DedA with SNARE-associated domain